ncbi:MAG: hypothetical protein KatS3mg081_1199 [Gemmatimonadales bacterium]|nr:hypothetical protein HRbin33_00448 [bacterium HR33]GIW51844.1 MAG: hypothetical protein KatS3mg081_1199 [Gemmatimonadales bacterium]
MAGYLTLGVPGAKLAVPGSPGVVATTMRAVETACQLPR